MVAINREQHFAVLGASWWVKRKETSASHGRGLRHDLPSFGLLKNDRLEPWEGMLDVAEFDSWDAFPRTVLFWRSSRQTSTKHRNPIFSATTGIQPNTSMSVCWLHTLSLGPFQCTACALSTDLYQPTRGKSTQLRKRLSSRCPLCTCAQN